MFTVGPTFFSGGGAVDENGLPVHGLLNHFDSLSGANAVSAIGPNMIPDSAPVGIQSGVSKFGGSAMKNVQGAFYTSTLTGMTLRSTKSWRADMWVNVTTAGNAYLFIHNIPQTRYVQIYYTGTLGSAYHYDVKVNGLSSSGACGAVANGLTTGVWQHLALQYNAATLDMAIYNDGKRCCSVIGGANGFDIAGVPTVMDNFRVGNTMAGGYVDEARFRFILDSEVYPNNGDGVAAYTVPSGPY
jgi:hypothetical protein